MPRRRLLSAFVLSGTILLTGCSGPESFNTLNVTPGADSNNPDCARIMLAMPKEMSGSKQRETNSQGTTAYGDPSTVIVRCGVQEILATNDPCASVNGTDWISRQEKDNPDTWVFTSYGKTPTVEVTMDSKKAVSSDVLVSFSDIMKKMPDNGHKCLSSKDVSLPQ